MTAVSKAHTVWKGPLMEGSGTVSLESSGAGTHDLTWDARSTGASGATTPEELLGAAHSACFSMALANALTAAGTPPEDLSTGADVSFDPAKGITGIRLYVVGRVEGLSEDDFRIEAERAKKNCPVSQALKGVPVELSASLR
ncbi:MULTISPECIES: OsmC family peroxiredoxin [Brevibacterium]|jgi:osmotically inducible protein OsmC|uniref:OsmC family protein n=1 Tax=Brevibacterium salitolerans TaxID=1403566 RepID=A0ABN2WFE8_9MICO|nr:OsmC family peroxiredoxin [Brevibacterium sp.]